MRALIAGLAIGAAMTIKPQSLIGALPVGLFLAAEWRDAPQREEGRDDTRTWRGSAAATAAAMTAGIGIVLAALVGVLLWLGALGALWDIGTGYLPLYGEMSGDHVLLPPAERTASLLASWARLGNHYGWLIAAAIGSGLA